ncbi:hypothetical protein [Photorhabdus bodei]|uniref:Transposase n=1 Tax=Photorhabdus bodei TaxID=2029681 RepID=A0AAW6BMV6_9GAMM|nr:hypothetical protein [Photorhabdus bodei]MDB6373866.1 hypothetical protein [Photorhabdus bodei]
MITLPGGSSVTTIVCGNVTLMARNGTHILDTLRRKLPNAALHYRQ